MNKKLYILLDLAEEQVESLLAYVWDCNSKDKLKNDIEMISLDTDGKFMDGSPKYIAKLRTNNEELISKFTKVKSKNN